MKTVRIAAAQTAEFREDIEAALSCAADFAARDETAGAALLCFPEGFFQGYLTDEMPARRNALDLASPGFDAVLNRLPGRGAAAVGKNRIAGLRYSLPIKPQRLSAGMSPTL
jgi:predicted amidohydrolase